jgi:hypothetical protein
MKSLIHSMNHKPVTILLLCLVMLVPAFSWVKFTAEELALQAPEWCPNADAMVIDKSSTTTFG